MFCYNGNNIAKQTYLNIVHARRLRVSIDNDFAYSHFSYRFSYNLLIRLASVFFGFVQSQILSISLYKFVKLLKYFCKSIFHPNFLANQINGIFFIPFIIFYFAHPGPYAFSISKTLFLYEKNACNVCSYVAIELKS